VFSTVAAYLTIASLLGRAADARSAAAKAWSNAVLPLDRKLAIYNRALQNWHAGRGSSPMARSKLLTLVMHGVAGPSTVHFLDDKMAEPSLSRMHQAVETATTATESALNNRLLVSAKLLCYHAGELLASSRLDCAGFKPREIGLDAQLCRIFLQEAEDLALCIEAAICDIRKARRDLSGLFKWFKALHAFVGMHKKSTSNDVDDDFFKFILKARDQQGIASFLVAGKLIESASYSSNTEAILDFEVTKLLADLKPGSVKAPMTSFRPQNISNLTPEAIADQIRSCVEKERKADTAKASYSPPVLDHVDNDDLSDAEAFVIHAKLRAVRIPA
jgi:hypothetical protein